MLVLTRVMAEDIPPKALGSAIFMESKKTGERIIVKLVRRDHGAVSIGIEAPSDWIIERDDCAIEKRRIRHD